MSSRIKKEKQHLYITNKLKNIEPCVLHTEKDKIKDILNNRFMSGLDMNVVVCMFDSLFLSTAKSKKNGFFHLSVHVSEWVKKLEKIDVNSTSGYVYITDILSDIQVILKLPQDKSDYNEMIREYFIGVTSINKIRYILPNFVYTFGAFMCPFEKNKLCNGNDKDSIPFVIFEKINGDNMQKMLENDNLTFSQYLGMFIQVLLALEVAQRNISFTHFDLHTGNLMCKTIENTCKYNVPLDNKVYEVTAFEYLPVIIDFGLSTVKDDNVIVGSYTFPEHGMKHYMIPGVDMYKFLCYSCVFSEGNLQRQIINLLSFYGNDDPYKIMIGGDKAIDKATDEYTKKGSYSRITTHTPLEFLNWILEQPQYDDITSLYIKRKERDIIAPLIFPKIIQNKPDIENALKLINENTREGSYIMSKYSIYVLNGYNKQLDSKYIKNDIKMITKNISKFRNEMISNDYKQFLGYKKIFIPDIFQIKDDSKRILTIKINSKKLKSMKTTVLKLIERYYTNTSLFVDILPYLQFVYTIKEIKAEKVYNKMILKFLTSSQYIFYNQHYNFINTTSRWCQTLLDSMDIIT
jgi:hypothetical protein